MKVVIISGSNRTGSESGRVARYLSERVKKVTKMEPILIDLAEHRFSPSPDDNSGGKMEPDFKKIQDAIAESDALILISPEWAGSVSPLLRALLIFTHPLASGNKPGLLVGVSAGNGGAYPIQELKGSGNKNNFINFIPEHLIFRDVGSLLKGDHPTSEPDKYIRERSDYTLRILEEYAKALKQVRASGVIDLKKYRNGM